MPLRAKQQQFVKEYLIDRNATQAAIRAGYSAKTAGAVGHENLKKPEIAAAIADEQGKINEKAGIDALWVLQQAASVYAEAREEKDRPSALKALDIVGKHVDVQAFKEKVDVDGKLTVEEVRRVIVDPNKHGESEE